MGEGPEYQTGTIYVSSPELEPELLTYYQPKYSFKLIEDKIICTYDGAEALARNPNGIGVPTHLFQTIEDSTANTLRIIQGVVDSKNDFLTAVNIDPAILSYGNNIQNILVELARIHETEVKSRQRYDFTRLPIILEILEGRRYHCGFTFCYALRELHEHYSKIPICFDDIGGEIKDLDNLKGNVIQNLLPEFLVDSILLKKFKFIHSLKFDRSVLKAAIEINSANKGNPLLSLIEDVAKAALPKRTEPLKIIFEGVEESEEGDQMLRLLAGVVKENPDIQFGVQGFKLSRALPINQLKEFLETGGREFVFAI